MRSLAAALLLACSGAAFAEGTLWPLYTGGRLPAYTPGVEPIPGTRYATPALCSVRDYARSLAFAVGDAQASAFMLVAGHRRGVCVVVDLRTDRRLEVIVIDQDREIVESVGGIRMGVWHVRHPEADQEYWVWWPESAWEEGRPMGDYR